MTPVERLREVCAQVQQLVDSGDKRYQDLPAILEDLRILQAGLGDVTPEVLAHTVEQNGLDDVVYLQCPRPDCPWTLEGIEGKTLAEILGEATLHREDFHR